MPQRSTKPLSRTSQSGFAAILIAALFVGFAIVATVYLDKLTVSNTLQQRTAHQVQLSKLQGALTKFLLKEGRLPCPARYSVNPDDTLVNANGTSMATEYGVEMHPVRNDATAVSSISDCSKALDATDPNHVGDAANWSMGLGIDELTSTNGEYLRGMVPFKALEPYGVTEDDVYDAQGDRIMYIVNRQLTGGQGVTNPDTNPAHLANDFVYTSGSNKGNSMGSATGYALEQASIQDSVASKTYNVDFVVLSYGLDKQGGLGHDQRPAGQTDCTQTNTNVAQKLLLCNITTPVACPTGTPLPLSAINCGTGINYAIAPQNVAQQTTAAATYTNNTYFDDQLTGASVTCANGTFTRNEDGQCSNVYCWGNNRSGQLGNGTYSPSGLTTGDAAKPTSVNLPRGVVSFQSIGVSQDTTTIPTPNSTYVTACGLSSDIQGNAYGDVYCWGKNTAPPNSSEVPVKIDASGINANFKFTSIQVGYNSSCGMGGVVTAGTFGGNDGKIYCWGQNYWGQIGNITLPTGVTTWKVTPSAVTFPVGVTSFSSFSGDGAHWCALSGTAGNNNIYCWGSNNQGQLGLSAKDSLAHVTPLIATAVMTKITTSGKMVISIGSKGSVATLSDGSLIGWGSIWPDTGLLYGPTDITADAHVQSILVGPPVVTLNNVEATRDITPFVASSSWGQGQQCISFANSGIPSDTYCKGKDNVGELGDGITPITTHTTTSFGTKVKLPNNVALTAISAGDGLTCGVGTDGKIYCWGSNSYGQLGANLSPTTTANSSTPVLVQTPNTVHSMISVSASGTSACALATP